MDELLVQKSLPLVTIGIPVYNTENYIRFTLQSILSQTYTNWLLIIINDGSTDNSEAIIREYLHDKRIKLINGHNTGYVIRLNQLINLCETKYYFRMDADDIMHPERLERQIKVMENNPEIDVLGTNAYSIDGDNFVTGVRLNYKDVDYLKNVTSFIHPTVMGKTQWFKDNLYDEEILRIEDLELWHRMAGCSNFKIITNPLLFYREVGNGYFRKYSAISKSRKRIKEKYGNDPFWTKFFIKNTINGFIYRIFNLFNKEQTLVNKRNKVIFNERLSYENYIS